MWLVIFSADFMQTADSAWQARMGVSTSRAVHIDRGDSATYDREIEVHIFELNTNHKRELAMAGKKCTASDLSLEDSGFAHTMSLIGGKYKMIILYWLSIQGPAIRFNELKRSIGTISFKTLSVTLKELEADDLVVRKEYPQIPPKVEYSLSRRGQSLMPVLDTMCRWGDKNRRKAPQKRMVRKAKDE